MRWKTPITKPAVPLNFAGTGSFLVEFDFDGHKNFGITTNVTTQGLQLEGDYNIPIDAILNIRLKRGSECVSLIGTVHSISDTKEINRKRLGIRFLEIL